MITIREMMDKDLKAVKLIEDECFVEPWKESDLEYELHDNPINKFYVALDGEKVVGFIDFMITFNSATISQVAVAKKYREQGIASKLLEKMYETLPTSGEDIVEFITLEVRESNLPARSLYLKHGFEEVVIKKAYYPNGENAVYMLKRMQS